MDFNGVYYIVIDWKEYHRLNYDNRNCDCNYKLLRLRRQQRDHSVFESSCQLLYPSDEVLIVFSLIRPVIELESTVLAADALSIRSLISRNPS